MCPQPDALQMRGSAGEIGYDVGRQKMHNFIVIKIVDFGIMIKGISLPTQKDKQEIPRKLMKVKESSTLHTNTR